MARKSDRPQSAAAQPVANPVQAIKDAARNHWAAILAAVANVPADILDGGHHPCPRKCDPNQGGNDRFRFTDQAGDGSIICNQCARRECGDGLATIRWLTGWTFPEVLRRVADHLGIDTTAGTNGNGKYHGNGKPAADPAEHLEFMPWNHSLVALFCAAKPPIKPEAIQAVGGRLARYRGRYTVIALPVVGKDLDHSKPVGWVLYNVTGGTLPAYKPKAGGGYDVEQVKVKTTPGTQRGLMGVFQR